MHCCCISAAHAYVLELAAIVPEPPIKQNVTELAAGSLQLCCQFTMSCFIPSQLDTFVSKDALPRPLVPVGEVTQSSSTADLREHHDEPRQLLASSDGHQTLMDNTADLCVQSWAPGHVYAST